LTTVLNPDEPAGQPPSLPPVNGKAFNEFIALAVGLTDDFGFRTRGHGDMIRVLGPQVRPLQYPFELFVNGWNGESVLVTSPTVAREVYTLPTDVADFEVPKRWLRLVMGSNSPFVLGGRDHVAVRQAIVPELTVAKVERYRELSVEVLDGMIDKLRLNAPVSLRDFYAAFAQEMILRFTFGLEAGAELDRCRHWLNTAINHSTRQPALLGFLAGSAVSLRKPGHDEVPRFLLRARRIRRQTDMMIQEKLDELRLRPRDCLASRLLERQQADPKFWTEKVLRDVIATLLFAGHDTSVSAYQWATEYLLHNAHPRDRLVAEACEGRSDAYAQAVTMEAVRLKPPVWGMQAYIKKDVAIAGNLVRAGTWVFMLASAVHQDETVYPEPRSFRPERFLDTTPDRYGMLAFSNGRHRCPGVTFFNTEANIVLHRMFGRLEMEPCLAHLDRTFMAFGFFNRPKNGTRVVVRSRRSATEVPVYCPAAAEADRHSALHEAMIAETDASASNCPVPH
jgi:cytochrome P450